MNLLPLHRKLLYDMLGDAMNKNNLEIEENVYCSS